MAYFNAMKAVVTLGASANNACRKEMQNVVGKLSDELDRALSLSDSYLVGVQFSKDDKEMAQYLSDSGQKLMGSFMSTTSAPAFIILPTNSNKSLISSGTRFL